MSGNNGNIDEHVGELLSGYIDGELTQQQRQRVDVHCENCRRCDEERAALRRQRERVGRARLSELGEDKWRESVNDTSTNAVRAIGWLLLVGGILAAAGIFVFEFVTDPHAETSAKVIVGAIYGGVALLFLSVLRQRLIERKTDKYKDVEI